MKLGYIRIKVKPHKMQKLWKKVAIGNDKGVYEK